MGVMLLDLARLRLTDWDQMWKSVAHRVLTIHQYTGFDDQVGLFF